MMTGVTISDAQLAIDDAHLAIDAALAGAAVVRQRFGQPLERFDKGGGDFATAADLESERAVTALLQTARPDDAVLGEEYGLSKVADRTWLIDPLCGTLNFAAQTMVVAVNVALRVATDVTVSAVADPFSGEVFWTDGEQALRRLDGSDEVLRPAADSRLVDFGIDGTPNRVTGLLTARGFAGQFMPRVLSSSLPLAWVAAGRRAGYVSAWGAFDSVHHAAGLAVCRAAGCVVTDLSGQAVGSGSGGLLVAADAETHAALLALVPERG